MTRERGIKVEPKPNWRLRKTLARKIDIRLMQPGDMKYLWAAYKKGALSPMGEDFAIPDMDASAFKVAFEAKAEKFSEGWVVSADTAKGFIPCGAIFGKFDAVLPFMIVAGIVWFPWASSRNIIEGSVTFFHSVRKPIPTMLFATDEHKRLYEVVCMHGIMRRVGTSSIAFPGQQAAVFETRV